MKNFLFVVVLMLVVVMPVLTQSVKVQENLFINERITNSETDTLKAGYSDGIPIEYNGSLSVLYGEMPDSMVLHWAAVAPSDSISGDWYIYTKDISGTWNKGASILDSVKADEVDRIKLAYTVYQDAVAVGFIFVARSAGNAIAVANKNAFWAVLDKYYRKP